MHDPHNFRPIVRRAVLPLDPETHRIMLEVLWYVESRHYFIDPDMYRIDLEKLAALKRLFRADEDEPCATVSMTHDDVFALVMIVSAADTYSHRHKEPPIDNVTDPQLAWLGEWVERAERWFITPLKEE